MRNQISRRELLAAAAAAGAAATLGAARLPSGVNGGVAGDYQIGCFTRPWSDEHYLVAFDAIAEAGYKHVGFMTTKLPGSYIITYRTSIEDAAKAGEEAKKRGLSVPAAWGGGLPVEKSVEEGIAALRKLVDNAAVAGVGTLIMGGTGLKGYDAYYKAIAECCDYAAEKHVALVIKPHGGLNSTGEQCKKTVEKVGQKNFHLWYDPGNIFYYSNGKVDPADDASAAAGVVSGMCVKDFKPPKNVDVSPGDGQVNFKKVLQVLRQGGFTQGPLVVETLGPVQGAKERIAEAKIAREFVENVVGSLR
jgi:sugar phosphate isomerase/epimerase